MKTVSRGLLLLLLSSTLIVAQSAARRVVDPFFFVEYDLADVHFEPIPALIGNRCPQLQNHYVEAWVYGHLKTHDAEYFIVDGYVKLESENHPSHFSVVPEDGFGYIVELREERCLVDPTPYVFFPELNKGKSKFHLSDAVLDAISVELLERYAKAFGGKRQFLKKIETSDLHGLPAVVKKQLGQFEDQRH